MPAIRKEDLLKTNSLGIAETFADPMVLKDVEVDAQLLDTYDRLFREVELQILHRARKHDPITFQLLRHYTRNGRGTRHDHSLVYEIHDIRRAVNMMMR